MFFFSTVNLSVSLTVRQLAAYSFSMRVGSDPPSQSASLGVPLSCLLWAVKLAEEIQLTETLISQTPPQKSAGEEIDQAIFQPAVSSAG